MNTPSRSSFHHRLVARPGHPALDLPGQRERRPAHFFEALLGLDAHVDVDPPRPRRLREALEVVLREHLADRQAPPGGSRPKGTPGLGSRSTRSSSGWSRSARRTGHGFQSITPRFTPHRQVGAVVRHQLAGVAPAGERHGGGLQPFRSAGRNPLLEERLASDAVHPPLQDGGALAQATHDRLLALDVVVGEVELRQPRLREEDLPRVAEPHLASAGLQLDALTLLRGHRLKGCRM